VRPGEPEVFANEIGQVFARADAPGLVPPVDRQGYRAEAARTSAARTNAIM
jgi:hypothetical protein